MSADACLVCTAERLLPVPGFGELPRITSDCRPFRPGGELFVCEECGAAQKRASAVWLEEIGEIYRAYASYYQSGGDEQIVFDRASGRPRRRSDVILERLVPHLPSAGAVLDVGCGNGVTLKSMSAALPSWELNGYEIGEGALPLLKSIPRFHRLHTGDLQGIDRTFDLVSMIHSLEHFPSPADALRQIRALTDGGTLFVQVCNVEENPFDVLVADHLMHFSPDSLTRLLARTGFRVGQLATGWVPKEISLTARRGTAPAVAPDPDRAQVRYRQIGGYVAWLKELTDLGRRLAGENRPLAIFGTSIAATWLGSQLADGIQFFVDEDPSRAGRTHLGKPILPPADVPDGCTVYLALAPSVATMIASRLQHGRMRLVLPPAAAAHSP